MLSRIRAIGNRSDAPPYLQRQVQISNVMAVYLGILGVVYGGISVWMEPILSVFPFSAAAAGALSLYLNHRGFVRAGRLLTAVAPVLFATLYHAMLTGRHLEFIPAVFLAQFGFTLYPWLLFDRREPAALFSTVVFSFLILGLQIPLGQMIDLRVDPTFFHTSGGRLLAYVLSFLIIVIGMSEFMTRNYHAELFNENLINQVLDNSYQLMGLLSLDGRVVKVNKTALSIAGKTEDAFLGRYFPDTDWWRNDRDQRELLIQAMNRCRRGEVVRFTATHPIPGGESRYFDFSLSPVLDHQSRVTYLLPESRDITDQVTAERKIRSLNEKLEQKVGERTRELHLSMERLREAQDRLVEQRHLASLSQLIAGMAHEMGTPVGVSVTASSFVAEELRELSHQCAQEEIDPRAVREKMNKVFESADIVDTNLHKAAELLERFKEVTGSGLLEPSVAVNIRSWFTGMLPVFTQQITSRRIAVDLDIDPDLCVVVIPKVMFQISRSIIDNAIHHGMERTNSGRIGISFLVDAGTAVWTISNDGLPMAGDIIPRVFEPFTTSVRGQGHGGLGLYLVNNIVHGILDGEISVENLPDEAGVQVTIRFPVEIAESAAVG